MIVTYAVDMTSDCCTLSVFFEMQDYLRDVVCESKMSPSFTACITKVIKINTS